MIFHLYSPDTMRTFHITRRSAFISEESRKEFTFFQGVNSWGYGSHGYKGLDTFRKTGRHHYVLTMYSIDTTSGLDTTNSSKGKLFRSMEILNTLVYKILIGTYQRFNRG